MSVLRTWEFSAGLRSISPIYLLSGPSFSLLKQVSKLRTSYWALVLPRLVACISSLLIDFSVVQLCDLFSLQSSAVLIILASSYTMFTYLSRPFSNSLETAIFSLLLVLVVKVVKNIQCIEAQKKLEEMEELENDRYERITLEEFRKREKTKPMGDTESKYKDGNDGNVFLIGVVAAVGVFIRPTFAVFSFGPIIWLLGVAVVSGDRPISYLFLMIGGAVIPSAVFILTDTVYYSDMTVLDILAEFRQCVVTPGDVAECWEGFFSLFTVTPWNFLKYNTDPANVSLHGRHPHYTHLLVNVPLLLGPLVVYILRALYRVCLGDSPPNTTTLLCFLTAPILLLSLVPHQEPRFLLPVLPLGILLCAPSINRTKHKGLLITLWGAFNLACLVFYGFLHQGGVIPLVSYIQKNLHGGNSLFTNKDTFFFYHTYMPPRSLLLSNSSLEQIIDLQGSSVQILAESVKSRKGCCSYLAVPGTLLDMVTQQKIRYDVINTFPLHLSMEDPPPYAVIRELWNEWMKKSSINKLSNAFSLFFLKIKS